MEAQMIRELKVVFFIVIVLSLGVIIGCSNREEKILAKIGDRVITIGDFENDFIKGKAKSVIETASDSMKLEHLNKMIDKELKILEAYDKNLDQDSILVLRMKDREKNEVGRKVWLKEVVEKVITESEIQEFYENSQKEVRVRDILLRTNEKNSSEHENEIKEKIQKLYEDAKSGAKFDSLAIQYSQNSETAPKGGDLGFLKWHPGVIQNELYRVAFNLNEGEISKPFQKSDGFHIIKVEETKHIKPTETFEKQKDKIRERLMRARSQELKTRMNDYMEELMEKYNGRVFDVNIKTIVEKLNVTDSSDVTASDSLAKPSRPRIPNDFSKLTEEDTNLILFEYNGGEISAGTLINDIKRYPPYRQPDFTQEKNLKEFLNGRILFEIYVYEGYQRGNDKDEDVRKLLTEQIENSIQRAIYQEEVVNRCNPTEEEVKKYYEENKRKYRQQPFNKVRNQVRNEMVRENRLQMEKEWLDNLKKKYKVVIHGNRLRETGKKS